MTALHTVLGTLAAELAAWQGFLFVLHETQTPKHRG